MARAPPAMTDHDQVLNRPARASRHLLRGGRLAKTTARPYRERATASRGREI